LIPLLSVVYLTFSGWDTFGERKFLETIESGLFCKPVVLPFVQPTLSKQ